MSKMDASTDLKQNSCVVVVEGRMSEADVTETMQTL